MLEKILILFLKDMKKEKAISPALAVLHIWKKLVELTSSFIGHSNFQLDY